MRCFIAIELPENVKAKIFHEFETLKKKNLFGGKFVGKESLHITLKFLGELTLEKVNEVKEKMKKIDFSKFVCEIGKSGFFDNEKRIKVIWIEAISKYLEQLEKKISEKFPEFPPDYKKFSPHITTARVEYINDIKGLIENIKNVHMKNTRFEVEKMVLMKSEVTRGGIKYKILESVDFS